MKVSSHLCTFAQAIPSLQNTFSPWVSVKVQHTVFVTSSNGTSAESLQFSQLEPVHLDGHSPENSSYVTNHIHHLSWVVWFLHLTHHRWGCSAGAMFPSFPQGLGWDKPHRSEGPRGEDSSAPPFLQLVVADMPLLFSGSSLLWFLLPSPGPSTLHSISNPNL